MTFDFPPRLMTISTKLADQNIRLSASRSAPKRRSGQKESSVRCTSSKGTTSNLEAVANACLEADCICRAIFISVNAPLGIAIDYDISADTRFCTRRQNRRIFVTKWRWLPFFISEGVTSTGVDVSVVSDGNVVGYKGHDCRTFTAKQNGTPYRNRGIGNGKTTLNIAAQRCGIATLSTVGNACRNARTDVAVVEGDGSS